MFYFSFPQFSVPNVKEIQQLTLEVGGGGVVDKCTENFPLVFKGGIAASCVCAARERGPPHNGRGKCYVFIHLNG